MNPLTYKGNIKHSHVNVLCGYFNFNPSLNIQEKVRRRGYVTIICYCIVLA